IVGVEWELVGVEGPFGLGRRPDAGQFLGEQAGGGEGGGAEREAAQEGTAAAEKGVPHDKVPRGEEVGCCYSTTDPYRGARGQRRTAGAVPLKQERNSPRSCRKSVRRADR